MLYEDLRFIHEDVERLEQAISDRNLENPRHDRNVLARDHEIAHFVEKIQAQSERALRIYNDMQDARMREIQSISTGETFDEFYSQFNTIQAFHKRNPNDRVENLEVAYSRPEKGGPMAGFAGDMNSLFTGEEAFGKFFDLTLLHEEYLNLPGIRGVRRITYLQYLDIFDAFTPPKGPFPKQDKLTDAYFSYIGSLAQYLESYMKKSKPLENLEAIFAGITTEFEAQWESGKIPGWEQTNGTNGTQSGIETQGAGTGIWCADCEKEFGNENTYKAHLTGKKHIKNAESKQSKRSGAANGHASQPTARDTARLREKAIAEREYRIQKLSNAMKSIRADTRVNVERKQGMTEKERAEEIRALFAGEDTPVATEEDEENKDEDERISNPLNLPLAWDGKPIPFWLYKLHGLGTEYSCEICGNFVYMGRRAFEKHFSEPRHIHGLKCLGITSTSLFREITQISEAELLWNKLQQDRKVKTDTQEDIVEMEDNSGVVMPLKVYNDLAREGLL